MFYYLYKITNLVNNKFYVGVHKTSNLNDQYMGSGKVITAAIKKYGIENFKKEILEFFDTADLMFSREKEIVTEEFLTRSDVYNLRRGGTGGFDYINKDYELIQRRNKNIANNRDFSNQLAAIRESKKSVEYKKKISEALKEHFKTAPGTFLGRTHSDETKNKISAANKGARKGTGNSQYGTMWITNGVESKKIPKHEPIPMGWKAGRVISRIS